MNVQELKKIIVEFIKREKKIDSELGTIFIKEKIGEGGNALVYKAEFGKNKVALKVLAEEKDSSKYKRFLTEFREIVQLAETKAVVPIYYFGHLDIGEKKFPYMVMKKYPNTLKSWRACNPINDFESFAPLLTNLLNIVSVIHEKNIIHRDLKPENILVSESGEMVLADFGISWFDSEMYARLVHTRQGDRMANFDFSAPEQFIKGSEPHPTMDIFALGQLITWLITGGVARGNRTALTTKDSSYAVIESVVSMMLNREPKQRQQSIGEVYDMIRRNIKERDENASTQKEIERVIGELRKFDDVLRFCFPGKRGRIETENSIKINTVMTEINNLIGETDLWWTQGSSNCHINRKMYKINEDTWVMDGQEMQVEKVWALKDAYSLDHQFLVIKTKPMPVFGIYDEAVGAEWEEAAWYKERYISRAEYDDGVADIDGESVLLNGEAQVRIRSLRPEYYFIGTQSHPILLPENDDVVSKVYEKLLETDFLDEKDLKKLTGLRRHRISIMMN